MSKPRADGVATGRVSARGGGEVQVVGGGSGWVVQAGRVGVARAARAMSGVARRRERTGGVFEGWVPTWGSPSGLVILGRLETFNERCNAKGIAPNGLL